MRPQPSASAGQLVEALAGILWASAFISSILDRIQKTYNHIRCATGVINGEQKRSLRTEI